MTERKLFRMGVALHAAMAVAAVMPPVRTEQSRSVDLPFDDDYLACLPALRRHYNRTPRPWRTWPGCQRRRIQ